MKRRWLKGTFIGVGAVVLSTLGIFAADTLQGIDTGIGNLASLGETGVCKSDAVPVKVDGTIVCVDKYEASPSGDCLFKTVTNATESERNINTKNCFAVSTQNATPWNYISLPQAQRMCAQTGKRLPSSNEWYAYALGSDPDSCVVDSKTSANTGISSCISSVGAEDVIGNLWEWVDESVVEGNFNGQTLPGEGYVSSVDADGIALTSSESPDTLYGEDYFWSKPEGVYGMIRGGFYGSGRDAGLYTVNASVQTSLATLGIGFRCVEDVL